MINFLWIWVIAKSLIVLWILILNKFKDSGFKDTFGYLHNTYISMLAGTGFVGLSYIYYILVLFILCKNRRLLFKFY